ncbi:MAG: VWA domain-containing protein, partial [Rhodomicrobium sp.]
MRDLAVAALIDVSRSTEAFVGERAVIDVEKEALIALSEGLAACQDDFALYAFSSLRRDRVWVTTLKDFKEPNGPAIRARIGCLTPGHYTRLGGAIRHVSSCLAKRENSLRLLLVISDGKPNDLDHYEGRYGIEDSRKAIFEARAQGQAVFGIAVDKDAGAYIPRIFGAGAYAIVSKPGRLTNALPYLYRQMVRS